MSKEQPKINRRKDQDAHIQVYRAVDFHGFSGGTYIPALRTASDAKTNDSDFALPGFYLINHALVFIQPSLRQVPLFVCTEQESQQEDIILRIKYEALKLFEKDPSLVPFQNLEEESEEEPKERETLESKGYTPPGFKQIEPKAQVKRFVSFLEDICRTPSPYTFAGDVERAFNSHYTKADKGRAFRQEVSKHIDLTTEIKNDFLALRTKNK